MAPAEGLLRGALGIPALLLVSTLSLSSPAQGTELDGRALEAAVMLEGEATCSNPEAVVPLVGAGILVGYNESSLFVLTAAHLLQLEAPNATGEAIGEASELCDHRFEAGVRGSDGPRTLPGVRILDRLEAPLDLALLEVPAEARDRPSTLPLAILPRDTPLAPGSSVVAIGHPGGVGWESLATTLEIPGVRDLQLGTRVIRGGFSGGPLFDPCWRLQGMVVREGNPFSRAYTGTWLLHQVEAWRERFGFRLALADAPECREDRHELVDSIIETGTSRFPLLPEPPDPLLSGSSQPRAVAEARRLLVEARSLLESQDVLCLPPPDFSQGLTRTRGQGYNQAAFTAVAKLDASLALVDVPWSHYYRAIARAELRAFGPAIADLRTAITDFRSRGDYESSSLAQRTLETVEAWSVATLDTVDHDRIRPSCTAEASTTVCELVGRTQWSELTPAEQSRRIEWLAELVAAAVTQEDPSPRRTTREQALSCLAEAASAKQLGRDPDLSVRLFELLVESARGLDEVPVAQYLEDLHQQLIRADRHQDALRALEPLGTELERDRRVRMALVAAMHPQVSRQAFEGSLAVYRIAPELEALLIEIQEVTEANRRLLLEVSEALDNAVQSGLHPDLQAVLGQVAALVEANQVSIDEFKGLVRQSDAGAIVDSSSTVSQSLASADRISRARTHLSTLVGLVDQVAWRLDNPKVILDNLQGFERKRDQRREYWNEDDNAAQLLAPILDWIMFDLQFNQARLGKGAGTNLRSGSAVSLLRSLHLADSTTRCCGPLMRFMGLVVYGLMPTGLQLLLDEFGGFDGHRFMPSFNAIDQMVDCEEETQFPHQGDHVYYCTLRPLLNFFRPFSLTENPNHGFPLLFDAFDRTEDEITRQILQPRERSSSYLDTFVANLDLEIEAALRSDRGSSAQFISLLVEVIRMLWGEDHQLELRRDLSDLDRQALEFAIAIQTFFMDRDDSDPSTAAGAERLRTLRRQVLLFENPAAWALVLASPNLYQGLDPEGVRELIQDFRQRHEEHHWLINAALFYKVFSNELIDDDRKRPLPTLLSLLEGENPQSFYIRWPFSPTFSQLLPEIEPVLGEQSHCQVEFNEPIVDTELQFGFEFQESGPAFSMRCHCCVLPNLREALAFGYHSEEKQWEAAVRELDKASEKSREDRYVAGILGSRLVGVLARDQPSDERMIDAIDRALQPLRGLDRSVDGLADLALAEILFYYRHPDRGTGASVKDAALEELHRYLNSDPESDEDPEGRLQDLDTLGQLAIEQQDPSLLGWWRQRLIEVRSLVLRHKLAKQDLSVDEPPEDWLEQGEEISEPEKLAHYAWFYQYAPPPFRDHSKTREYLERSNEAGLLDAQIQLGSLLLVEMEAVDEQGVDEQSVDEQTVERATQLLTPACELQIPVACNNLGILYSQGLVVEEDPAKAAEFLTIACEGGYAMGCENLAAILGQGLGVEPDLERARQLLERGCDLGQSSACSKLATVYYEGLGIESDPRRAAELDEKACDLGDTQSCVNLGFLVLHGQGVDQNLQRAEELFQASCDRQDLRGCKNLAILYRNLGKSRDFERAAELFEGNCEQGDHESCVELASLLKDGLGVARDPERSIALFAQACEDGLAIGCNNLGAMYHHGTGVTPDFERAIELYHSACENRYAQSCHNLGRLHQDPAGELYDLETAARFFRLACQLDNSMGCNQLGLLLLEESSAMAHDPDRAAFLFQLACDAGDAAGCNNLGTMLGKTGEAVAHFARACDLGYALGCRNLAWSYEHGEGAPPDLEQAALLYRKACRLENREGCLQLTALCSLEKDLIACF